MAAVTQITAAMPLVAPLLGTLAAGDKIALIGVIVATVGATFGLYQLWQNQRTVRGQFLLNLHQLFAPYDDIHRAVEDPDWRPDTAELARLRSYLGEFERLWIITERGLVDLNVIERLYGYRVQNLRENEYVREYLETNSHGWEDFFRCSDELNKAYLKRVGSSGTAPPPPLQRRAEAAGDAPTRSDSGSN